MTHSFLFPLTLATALGCGLIAGVFFAFSAFVMKALARIPAAQGIVAMQSINVVVINPVFLGVYLGAAAGCVALAITAVMRWHMPGAVYLFTGSLLYLIGTILVTGMFNIPRNNALAGIDPLKGEGERVWVGYVKSWTAWNHVRTAASLAAAALLTMAIR